MTRPALLLLLATVLTVGCARDAGPDPAAVAENNRGVGLMGRFDYAAAHEVFAELAEREPRQHPYRLNQAIALMNRQLEGDEASARAMLEALLAERPGDLAVRYTLALLLLRDGRAGDAAGHLRAVAEADPDDPYAAYFLGQALEADGANAAALDEYRRTIALDPYLRSSYYAAFMLLRRAGERDAAQAMADRFQRLATSPQARLVEFKYTRMGPKSEAQTLDAGSGEPPPAPAGPLFAGAESLLGGLQGARNLTVADIDGDGRLDLYAAGAQGTVLLRGADGRQRPAPEHPLSEIADVNTALWGDVDNDGRLDVYLLRRGPNQLWRQDGEGRWEQVTAASGTAGGDHDSVDGAIFDADHDGDLDLYVVNADAANELFSNNLDGSFRPLAAEHGLTGPEGARSLVLLDLEADRDTDLLLLAADAPHQAYANHLLWEYRAADALTPLLATPLQAAVAADDDADGLPEVYGWSPQAGVQRWRSSAESWSAESLGHPAAAAPGPAGMQMALLDADGDGRRELLLSHGEGWGVYAIEGGGLRLLEAHERPGLLHWTPLVADPARGPALVGVGADGDVHYWAPGPGRHRFLALAFSGRQREAEQMRSNASGIGTVGALRVDSRWSAFDTFRPHSGPGQDLQPLAVGLGAQARADFLRLTWSDGVLQTELALAGGELHRIEEVQRQLASCPVLFAWDGEKYAFVSDLLGVGGIGFAVGPGEYAEPRPWENFLLPAGLAQPQAGRYRFKLTEPMEEVAYLDAARLVAYDLPPGWDMVSDDRMGILGPAPTGEPLFFRGSEPAARAVDRRGADVTALLREADHRAAPVGELDRRFIGMLAHDHELTLTLAQPVDPARGTPLLVADGWVEYPYSQTSFAAWQAGAAYRAPTLEVRLADGRWQVLREQFGYPAGMPRRMALPLPELPAGVTALRLTGNMEVYWDRIALAYAEPLPQAVRRELPLAAAEVAPMGFPLRTTAAQRRPHYDYGERSPFWDTRHMAGAYSAFGPVEPLVSAVDAAVAIIGPGEEVHLEYTAPDGPPPAGWTRRLVLESHGWAKDMDLYTRDGATVGPLPGAPSAEREALHGRFNTRLMSGY